MESERWWIFTFGYDHKHAGHYVKFYGTYDEARQKMFDKYGSKWAFQYDAKTFDGKETELKEAKNENNY